MIYDASDFDLDAIVFEADSNCCRVCGAWGGTGYVKQKGGGFRMCHTCNGTGKKGGKAPSIPLEVTQTPKGREGFLDFSRM